ncbi:MalY/PatB family protein [Castellaniella sp.]|uniref:MalY/PatB family protein n=1 Tax=Castellaniella sp. TaxID=1955812 RepID=UPI002AFF7532|nr:MalY/PatB family protein [Castellaniella sp.]
MESEFDEVIDRQRTNSEKWASPDLQREWGDGGDEVIQMWVADMDFRAPAPVLDALQDAVRHGVFGYVFPSTGFVDSVVGWQGERHGWDVDPVWLLHTAGVVAGLSQIVRAFTSASDAVLIQPPVYGRFFKVPQANGRRVVCAPLREEDGCYGFDAVAFEHIIKRHRPRLFILCHPHNPVGKVWSEADLRQMGEICRRHEVLVVSDEIHQDFVFGQGKRHIPFASLGADFARNSITCTAPSKTFNLAGLQVSNLFVPDPGLREQLARELDRNGNHGINSLGMVACEAAYRQGAPWLDALLIYLRENHRRVSQALERIPGFRVFQSDALYLAWLDCRAQAMLDDALDERLRRRARVHLDSGIKFGEEGRGFVRMNLGCPRSVLAQALERMGNAFGADPHPSFRQEQAL